LDSSTQVKQYVDIAWRRKWWIVVPTLLAAAASAVCFWMMPELYRATTTILVTRQSVPEDMARSTVTSRVEERMRGLELQLLSRSYLEQVAREFQMFPAGANEADIERTCRKLSAQVFPEFDTKDFAWFRISVEDDDPNRAAGIANRLADLFIEQNSVMRASQAAGTLAATSGWEEKYRTELEKRDQAIAEFRQKHVDELPDQQPANVQFLNAAQTRFSQLTSDIQSRNDRLAALKAQRAPQEAPGAAPANDDPRLETAQKELAELLGTYTELHPIVKRKREQIAELLRSPPPPAPPGAHSMTASTGPIGVQIATIENEIRSLERDRVREEGDIAEYRAHIVNAQQVQQSLLELTRDYEQVKHQFDTAVVQNEQAQRSQDVEGSNRGEQFKIQDRAYANGVPYKRNLQYVAAIMIFGVALGVGASAARELVDQTVRSEDEFAAFFPEMPVYGAIPNLDFDPTSRAAGPAASRRRSA